MNTARIVGWLVGLALALIACATPPTQQPPPEEDFGFSLGDTVFAVLPGSSIATSATITPINGFAGSIDLTIANQDGTPVDPGITLDPGSITVTGGEPSRQSVQRQLTIEVAIAVANGEYDLRVTASSADLSSDADISLTVADNLTPQVAIVSPADGTVVTGSRRIQLSGTLSSLAPIIAVDVLGGADLVSMNFDQSSFSAIVELENNANSITVSASNDEGKVGVSSAVTASYPFLDQANFQNASVVIGQPGFVSNAVNQGGSAAANTLGAPFGNPLVTDSGMLFLADTGNHRVLGFDQIPSGNNASADFVLGQPDFATTTTGTSATTLDNPTSAHADGTHLAVSDNGNQRVLIWNAVPGTTQVAADVVVGQDDFAAATSGCDDSSFTNPVTALIADDKLIVTDNGNHRVLIWNSVPSSDGEPADVVLGQNSFTNCINDDDDQNGVSDGAPTARTLEFPNGVWSDGTRLAVMDTGNHRVLIWNTFPGSNFSPADLVLGQPDFVTSDPGADAQTFSFPRQVHVTANGQLLVADTSNSRILVFDGFPTVNGQAADRVLGQSTFTNSTGDDDDQDGLIDATPSARTLSFPSGVSAFDDKLIVNDSPNSRILIFESQ